MAWHLSGDFDGASIQGDLPTIMAQIETAVSERENMIFGLSTAAKTAADFDGYAIYYPGFDSEPTVYDWIVAIRVRILRLLGNTLTSKSVTPAITDRFGVFTNAARDKILSTVTTGNFLSIYSLTDYTSGWFSLSGMVMSDMRPWEQLRQTLDEMVYVCWGVAPRTEVSESVSFEWVPPSLGLSETFWDWIRGSTGAPSDSETNSIKIYSATEDGYSSISDGAWMAGAWGISAGDVTITAGPTGLGYSGLFKQGTDFEIESERIKGEIAAAYFGINKSAQKSDASTWSLSSNFEMTHEGTTYTLTGGDVDTYQETSVSDWPDRDANQLIELTWGTTPTSRPFDEIGAYEGTTAKFEVKFFLAPRNGDSFYNADSFTGTRVHTDITSELTYG